MKKEKVNNLINNMLNILLIIISTLILIIGISSIFVNGYFETTFYHPAEKTYFNFSIGIIQILISVLLLFLIYFFKKKILRKIPNYILLILVLIVSLGLYIYWIKAIQIMPSNDQKVILEMVEAFLNGNIDNYTQIDQYLFLYPYQIGITLIISLFFFFFGKNYLVFEYINALCSIINIVLLYLISKKMFKEKDIYKELIILLTGFSLYFMFFNVHFYGNIIGLTFALSSILFLFKYYEKNNIFYIILSSIFIKLSIIAKSNYDIFLIGIIIYIVINMIINFNKNKLIPIAVFLATLIITTLSYNILINNILKINLSNSGVPMISFVYMGMAEETDKSPGWYTGDPVKIYRESNYDKTIATNKTIELINNRLSFLFKNPRIFASYYIQKIASTWLNPTFQTIWCSLPGQRYNYDSEYAHYLSYHETSLSMVDGKLYEYEKFYFDIYQIIIFIFSGYGIIKLREEKNIKIILLPIIFFGGFLFHLIWETKSIYVLQYYFLLLPFAAYGINYTTSKIFNKKNNNNN